MDTIHVAIPGNKIPVPIRREVSLLGVPGFAVHRPLNILGDRPSNKLWNCSHMASGKAITMYCETPTDAIRQSEQFLLARYRHQGSKVPLATWLLTEIAKATQ